LAAALGLGKSSIVCEALVALIAYLYAAGLPHRILYLVPHHRLSAASESLMRGLGLLAAVWRGRKADDPARPGCTMCRNPDAVSTARAVGASAETAACGNGRDGPCCPFFQTCAYQQQKLAVRDADVVIAANTMLFGRVPADIAKGLALVVVDEGFWQQGLDLDRSIRMADFADSILTLGVCHRNKRQEPDGAATLRLMDLARRVERSFETIADGGLLSKAEAFAAGLTAESCHEARALERRRKVEPGLHPGMTSEQREAARSRAAVNGTLPSRVAIWLAIAELLRGDNEVTGRLQRTTLSKARGGGPGVVIQSRQEIAPILSALPILIYGRHTA
jgi:hypothetical protein